MWIIILILIIVTFCYGLLIMKKIDKFIAYGLISENRLFKADKKVIIYGDNSISKVVRKYFDNEKIEYDFIKNNMIEKLSDEYKYVLVLSESDLDNLMICSIAKKIFHMNNIISVCNNVSNKSIFDDYNIFNVSLEYSNSKECLLMIIKKIRDLN